jgi:hypothetical protein
MYRRLLNPMVRIPGEASASESSSTEPRRSCRVRRAPGAWWSGQSALLSGADDCDPKSYAEAVARPERDLCLESMQSEHDSLMDNGCCAPVPRPPNINVGRRGHPESRCWDKYPHLKPGYTGANQSGLAAKVKFDAGAGKSEENVCLMASVESQKILAASRTKWVMDSGASKHICHDRHLFTSLNVVDAFEIMIGDRSTVKAIGRGTVEVMLSVAGKPSRCKLENVVYAPTMGFDMFSGRAMCRNGKRTVFQERSCHVERHGRVLAKGVVSEVLYNLSTNAH